MAKKKQIVPRIIPWPPNPAMGVGKTMMLKQLTKNEVVQSDYNFLISAYPKMQQLFDSLFDHLPEEELPLLIGDDYPDWVHAQIERRFKEGRKP